MISAQFGLIAMIPAMFNLTIVSSGATLSVPICTGDGQVHTVQVPIGGSSEDGEPGLCCAKGCRNGNSRKRAAAKIEPAQ